ncbi:MAG: hypothetical protein AABY88_07610 [Pseudomonadota bacterium]
MSDSEIAFRAMLLDEFTPLVGHAFAADCEPQAVAITLVAATALRPNPVAPRPPFILIFHTQPEVFLVEGSYVLRCGQWGPDRISIWPTLAPPDGAPGHYYQAVFN